MKRNTTLRRLVTSLVIAAFLIVATAATAIAAQQLTMRTLLPDHVTPGRFMMTAVSIQNTGTEPLTGNLTVRYDLPDEIPATDPVAFADAPINMQCQFVGTVKECTADVTGTLPGAQIRLRTVSIVDPNATGTLTGEISASGGGALDAVAEPFSFIVGPSGPFAIRQFDIDISDAPTGPAFRAGSDPTDITTAIRLLSQAATNLDGPFAFLSTTAPTESFRDVVVHVPPGLVGNPTATPVLCEPPQLTSQAVPIQIPTCPPESQVGLVQVVGQDIVPLYNVVPPRGTPAAFGFYYNGIVVTLKAKLRPEDNGIDIVTEKAPNSVPLPKFEVTLWGAPTDRSHDNLRAFCLDGGLGYTARNGDCALGARSDVPFLRMPTSCPGTPLLWDIAIDTYEHVGRFITSSTTTPAIEGCQYNPFDPSLSLTPSTKAPHAPSGVDATVSMPQDWSVRGIAPADVRRVSVTLPRGLTINPSSADGLGACSDTDLRLRQEGVATCPDASKLGSVTLRTPLLDHELGGSIFLRTQNSDDPKSGELFRMAIEVRSDDDGVNLKLPGAIIAGDDGQLTTVFDDLPQLPFESMTLHFKTGPRAPLASPSTCGTHTTNVQLISWGDKIVDTTSSFDTVGCTSPRFEPKFRAGVRNPVAGGSSPFHVILNRSDDDSEFRGLTINTPEGLLGRIKAVEQCSNVAAETGSCPAASRVGSAIVGAGVGTNPYYVTNGRVFLTGPYRGAPYGLAVAVDAVAGPFNLGTVVVRQAIHVDPRTAQLRVVSQPFPTVVKGVPLHIRSVRVSIDKAGFMVSPTDCSKQEINGTATAVDGLSAPLESRFRVGGCKDLKFAPKLSLSVGGKGRTTLGRSTPFQAVLTQKPGQSNLESVKVSLPQTLAALLPVVNRACTLAEYNAGRCRKAEAGSAIARTPLLKDPLKGGAFFVRHPGRPLPDLMVALRGDIDIDLVGRVTIPGGKRLATNFDTIPDAPVSKFTLKIVAGSHGPLGVSTRSLCTSRAKRATADVVMRGQNGDVITRQQRLRIRGC